MKSKFISMAMLAGMLATPVSTAFAETNTTTTAQPKVEAKTVTEANDGATNTDTKLPDDTKVAYTINVNLKDKDGKVLATIPATVKDTNEKLYRVRSKALYDRYNQLLGKEFNEGQVKYKANEISQDVQRVLKDGIYVYTDNIDVKVDVVSGNTTTPKTDDKKNETKPSETPKADDKKNETKPSETPKTDDKKNETKPSETPKTDETKTDVTTPEVRDGDSDRVVYVANNGNSDTYYVNKSDMPANTNMQNVREMSEKEALKLGKHMSEVSAAKEPKKDDTTQQGQTDETKKDESAQNDQTNQSGQTDETKKEEPTKPEPTKPAQTTGDTKAATLPKTGDAANVAMSAIGSLMTATGAFFGFKRKK